MGYTGLPLIRGSLIVSSVVLGPACPSGGAISFGQGLGNRLRPEGDYPSQLWVFQTVTVPFITFHKIPFGGK